MLNLEKKMFAALKVYCLWSWLSLHPDKVKSDYPLFQELIRTQTNSLCPWCDAYQGKCGICPLGVAGEWCGNRSGWFQAWNTAGRYYRASMSENQRTVLLGERSWAAGEIANLAWKEYKRCELLSG